MTTKDKFGQVEEQLKALNALITDLRGEVEEQQQADAQLALMFVRLAQEFSSTGTMPLPESLKERLALMIDSGMSLYRLERQLAPIAVPERRQ